MTDSIKIWRSPYTDFGKNLENADDLLDETVTADEVYTDHCLAEIADSGFNGIWVHGLLHNIVSEAVFPELGSNAAVHQKKLNNLISRATKYGIKVYLYMQPPRALPVSYSWFWDKHSDIAGQIEEVQGDSGGDKFRVQALCTSVEKVKRYLKSASCELASKLPGLGGVILITASEFPSHCYTK